ncbi:hypothetical protein Cgig2_005451 [Carnegiea gigantea]|uniref:NmrA-like domain-containing protein n=1 Tax=Carnegiea gigantea TaxID=171969 RepID=A0A9Q1KC18_9CARY|nr:hypothetical protein Cgig2_005451 [Carnegiea gigantea]
MDNNGLVKKKVLIFGATGYVGVYMVKACAAAGHITYAYTRPLGSNPGDHDVKSEALKEFRAMGVTLVQGELDDHEKLVWTLKQVNIVISTLPVPQHLDQLKIINAMKDAGTIERFVPSEYGNEVDRVADALPPFQALLDNKKKVRRAIEAAGIPFTYVSANSLAAYFVDIVLHPHDRKNPQEVAVYGSGTTKAVWNYEGDVAAYTIRAAADPRTLNKVLIVRPPRNIASQLDVISSWEQKTAQILPKTYVPEDQLIMLSQTLPHPMNIPMAIVHSIFVRGDQMTFDLKEDDLEASALYPDYEYTSIDSRGWAQPRPMAGLQLRASSTGCLLKRREVVWNYDGDVAAYTIRAAADPRTLNKVLILRPPRNIASQLDVISSWEQKTAQILPKIYVPEDQLIMLSQTLPHPVNIPVAIVHNIFIKSDQMNFDLKEDDLEASALYPDYEYTSIDSFLDICLVNPPKVKPSSFT